MEKQVRILLIGIGGYGGTYLNPLLDGERTDCVIAGCVDPFASACRRIDAIRAKEIPVYDTMADFFADGGAADLCVISTPIHFHARQIREALTHGCHVLCEKPLCADPDEIASLIADRDQAGKYVGIGYQWSHSDAILALKRDILDGMYGKPEFLKTLVLWPRDFSYYGRGSGWAGKLYSADGDLILDSVANNATAHYLHNIFYILGDRLEASAEPLTIKAELRRANKIENYDTCRMDLTFADGVRALYLVSHATEAQQNPLFDYRFTEGRIVYGEGENADVIRGIRADGTEKIYGDPFVGVTNKLWRAVDAVRDASVKPVCGIEAAAVHTRCIFGAQQSGVTDFDPASIVLREDGSGVYVRGLYEEMMAAYRDAE